MYSFWDTTIPVFEYPSEFKTIYEKIYITQRKSFTGWVDKISKNFKDDIDWWSSTPASRNTYISKLFHNICIFESLKILEKKNKFPDKIVVESIQAKKIISTYFNEKDINIEIKNGIFLYNWFKKIYFIFWPLTFLIFIFLFSKIYKSKNLYLKGKQNILIDIFVTSGKLTTNRYYNKLEKKNKNIYFIPTIINVSILKLPKLIKQIRNNRNFILKEDFIYFSDIKYAFNYILRKKKFYVNYINYKNWNITNLIQLEFTNYSNFHAILISIINYRFAKNLRDKKIDLKKVIDWFENTTVDKGWNFGFRKFFPKTITLGYQGYTLYRQFMCKHPSKAEHLYKVIPNELVVVGKAYKNIRKEFYNRIKIRLGPALRFNHLFSHKNSLERKYNILVSLNMNKTESQKILSSVINSEYGQSNKKIFIKSHHLMPLSKIMHRHSIPKNFLELKDDFFKLAKNSRIVIAAGISSCIIESFACGCSFLIPHLDKNDYYNFKYLKIPNSSYKVCENSHELSKKIKHFLNEKKKDKNRRIKKADLLKSRLFEKVTKNNLKIFS